MTVELTAAGRPFRVTVEPDASGLPGIVTVRMQPLDDGGPADVRRARVDRTPQGLFLVDVADGRTVDAVVSSEGGGRWRVRLPGTTVVVSANGNRRQAPGRKGSAGGQRVVAPMPGRILRVLVAVGDQVQPGSALVVIEAMKMENALSASVAGTVHEVAVTEGLSVEAGRLVVRIE
jgi:biotin carboxyl carrier protein